MRINFEQETAACFPYAVIDQNCLRNPRIVSDAIEKAKRGRLILLHDIAMVEMTKSDEWLNTMRHSLALLAEYPQGVVAGRATGELMRCEMETGEPCPDIVDHDVTPRVRQLLSELKSGKTLMLDGIARAMPAAREMARIQQLDRLANRSILVTLADIWKRELTAPQLKQLRAGDEALFVELLAEKRMMATIADGLHKADYDLENARWLASVPSVSAHLWLCLAANALHWVLKGGIEGFRDERFTNELCDIDYLVAATFCAELITNDKRMAHFG